MVKNGPSASTSAALSSALGGADHQEVLVLLAGLGVDGVVPRRAREHEAARLGLLLDQVRRPVAPRRTELHLRQRAADRVDVGRPCARRLTDQHLAAGRAAARAPSRRPASGACPRPARRRAAARPCRCRPRRPSCPATISPGGSAPSAGVTRAELDPLAGVRRPGAGRGRAGAHLPVDRGRRLRPVDPGVVDGDLGRERHVVGGLRSRLERAVGDAVEGGDQQPGATLGEAREQLAGGVPRPDRLGHHAVRRTGVELARRSGTWSRR